MAVAEVAAFVVGHGFTGSFGTGFRRTKADFNQPFVNVLAFRIPEFGPFRIFRVVGQEMAVGCQMAAATARICDDRVKCVEVKGVKLAPGQGTGQLEFAIVGVE